MSSQGSLGFDVTHGFLGEEFLLWIWFHCETSGGQFELLGDRVIGIAIDDVLQFAPNGDDDTVQTLRRGLPTKSPEARTALRHGHRVSHVRLLIAEGSKQWTVTLHGADLRFGSVKLPEDAEDCESEADRTHDRVQDWLALHDIVAQLFARFVRGRASGYWKATAEEIGDWMAS